MLELALVLEMPPAAVAALDERDLATVIDVLEVRARG